MVETEQRYDFLIDNLHTQLTIGSLSQWKQWFLSPITILLQRRCSTTSHMKYDKTNIIINNDCYKKIIIFSLADSLFFENVSLNWMQ